MELLAPAMLGLLGLLVPLIGFYILKVRRQRRRVSSTWLWQQARRDLMARSPFKRLVVQIPLILQALVLILLAMAAARPATRGKAVDGDHVAIVIDTSASMSAVDPEAQVARIELAKQAAHAIIDSLAPGSDALILDAGRDTRIALPPDRDTRRMHNAIDKMAAREVEGDLAAAVALAVGRIGQQGGKGRVLVITDGNLARETKLQSPAVPMEVIQVGAPIANVGIVRVDVRAGRDPVLDKEQVQAFLSVANYGDAPREVFVTMRQQNASDTLASRKVVVEPKQKLPVVLSFYPAEGDYGTGLIFELSPHDGMAVDDRAFGRVPASYRLPVYFASQGSEASPWLLRALITDENAEVRSGTLTELLARPNVPHDAFVVVEGACPTNAPGADLLVVNPPGGDCFGALVGTKVDKPVITSWETSDVRLRFLTLEGVFLGHARLVEPVSQRQALIRTDQGVIAADISTSARSGTLLAFDVGESNWPLKASFVLFVRNLMEQARRHRSAGFTGPATAGAPLRVSVPNGVTAVDVLAPGAPEAVSQVARDGLVVIPEVEQAGLYRVSWEEPRGATIWLPVNLASDDESDLSRRLEQDPEAEVTVRPAAEAVAAHRDWGWVLALVALAFITFDVWYFTRPTKVRRMQPRRKPKEAAA